MPENGVAGVVGLEPTTPGFGDRADLCNIVPARTSPLSFQGLGRTYQTVLSCWYRLISARLGPNLGPDDATLRSDHPVPLRSGRRQPWRPDRTATPAPYRLCLILMMNAAGTPIRSPRKPYPRPSIAAHHRPGAVSAPNAAPMAQHRTVTSTRRLSFRCSLPSLRCSRRLIT